MTLIIGSEGSMGNRYKAILKYLGKPFDTYDVKIKSPTSIHHKIDRSDSIIISTPTDTHTYYLRMLNGYCGSILCEKPLATKDEHLLEIKDLVKDKKFSMMMQYENLPFTTGVWGDSYYNYFRTGQDGLAWDCIQIIGLAQGKVEVRNDSPVWKCKLNGSKLSLSDMDQGYIDSVSKWMGGKFHNIDYLMDIHQKVFKYIANH